MRQRRSIIQRMSLLDAIKAGNLDDVRRSLDEDVGLAQQTTPDGVSYVSLAMYHGKRDIARLIASRKGELDLYEACAVGDRERVETLVGRDARAGDARSPDGFAPIALAAFFGFPDIVQFLAEAGVDVNAQANNPMKVAAIHAAVAVRGARSVEILLRHGANPNLRQQNDITPLHVAQVNNDEQITLLLKEYGAQ